MTNRIRILFFSEAATFAHAVRPFLLAQTLPQEKFEIHFAVSDAYRLPWKKLPCTRHTLGSRSPEAFEATLQAGGILFDEELLSKYVEEDLSLIRSIIPDIIVGDFRLSLSVSARMQGVPYAALSNAYWSPYVADKSFPLPSFSFYRSLKLTDPERRARHAIGRRLFALQLPLIFKLQGKGLNRVRKEYGLSEFADYLEGFTDGDHVMYSDLPRIVACNNLPANHHYLGPICWSPDVEIPHELLKRDSGKPLIYCSLGSSGDTSIAAAMISVLGRLPVDVAFSTAKRIQNSSYPSNFFVAAELPGGTIARLSSLVISNGGSPSSYQALSAGTPVLGLPSNMDQLLAMKHFQHAGVARQLRTDCFTPQRFQRAVEELLMDNLCKKRAQALESEFAAYRPERTFPALVEKIVGQGRDRKRSAI